MYPKNKNAVQFTTYEASSSPSEPEFELFGKRSIGNSKNELPKELMKKLQDNLF